MNVKRFVAPDMRRALKMVREELGDDALILSNKSVDGGIEVLASIESDAAASQLVTRTTSTTRASSPKRASSTVTHLTNDQLNRGLLNKKKSKRPVETDRPADMYARKASSQKAASRKAPNQKGSPVNPNLETSRTAEANADARNKNLRDNKEIARLMLELDAAKKALAERGRDDNGSDYDNQHDNQYADDLADDLGSDLGADLQDKASAAALEYSEQVDSNSLDTIETYRDSETYSAPVDVIKLRGRSQPTSIDMSEQSHASELKNTAMEGELKQLRELLTMQMGEAMWGNMSYKNPIHAQVLKRLSALGLTNNLCKKVLDVLGDEPNIETAWRRALVKITKRIPIASNDIIDEGGVISLVGPTGAGKTTTIAKIAASYVLKYGAEDLALVTTDTYRIGAHEQLKTLGRILSVPVHIVSNEKSLADTLQQLGHKHLVLVDTAGLTRDDTSRQDQLVQLKECKARVRNYLVLPTTAQLKVQRAAVKDFEDLALCGCILSKLDETSSLGESISVLLENKLPVVYLTDGQKIPDDFHRATGPKIVSSAVAMMDEQSVDEMTMSALVGSFGAEHGEQQQAIPLAYAQNG